MNVNINKTIKDNEPLVFGIMARMLPYYGRLLPRDDMHAAGMVGLWRAAETFDPSRGVAFATHAWYWVVGAIKREAQKVHRSRRNTVPLRRCIADKSREESRLAADLVDVLIQHLTPTERQTVRLILDGWKRKEIAQADGVSHNAISERLRRAEGRMRNALAKLR